MDKAEILRQWMINHGDLSRDQRDRFLTRSEVLQLTMYLPTLVAEALRQERKLTDILAHANRDDDADLATPNLGTPIANPRSASRPRRRASNREGQSAREETTNREDPNPRVDRRYSRGNTPIRSRDGLVAQPPADAGLHRIIGPVQKYDDSF